MMKVVGRETRRATLQSIPFRLPARHLGHPPTCGVNRGKVQWGLGLPAEGPSYGEVLTLVWMPERYVPSPYQGQTNHLGYIYIYISRNNSHMPVDELHNTWVLKFYGSLYTIT